MLGKICHQGLNKVFKPLGRVDRKDWIICGSGLEGLGNLFENWLYRINTCGFYNLGGFLAV